MKSLKQRQPRLYKEILSQSINIKLVNAILISYAKMEFCEPQQGSCLLSGTQVSHL